MRKVKYRIFLDYDKEEKWVNDMAKEGWHLEKFSVGRFVFVKGEPGAFIYRNEYLGNLSEEEKVEYFALLQDSGATIVHESFNWIYVKKPVNEGPFELYTDASSKIDYYNRLLNSLLIVLIVNIAGATINFSIMGLSNKGVFNLGAGILHLLVAALICIPMVKIDKNKKKLKEQLFE
ncbi:DUF2812 domain-containing protein [Ureibacillus thermophilus]|uniref:DUF2812 domain-containing protein n=1 Tax=Ureibacillus thermophilus TaxID=367743 RepID=A0A4P6UPW3_9BACL|nr:DUF2812 domain-containing protein [Ureibacillus thermophilus]QBK25073.1 DUF2812 domain-containing protein [Ureibacillus thermophilus]